MAVVKSPNVECSLEELLDKLNPRIRQVLARFRIPFEDADDLVQQSVLTFLFKRDSIRNPESWLLGTIKNRCLMYWRARSRKIYRAVDTAILEVIAEPRRPEQEHSDLRRDLNAEISQLPDRCRSLLRLRYRLGCEPTEVARRLGYRTSSIYKVLERCLAALSRRLVASGLVENTPRT